MANQYASQGRSVLRKVSYFPVPDNRSVLRLTLYPRHFYKMSFIVAVSHKDIFFKGQIHRLHSKMSHSHLKSRFLNSCSRQLTTKSSIGYPIFNGEILVNHPIEIRDTPPRSSPIIYFFFQFCTNLPAPDYFFGKLLPPEYVIQFYPPQ